MNPVVVKVVCHCITSPLIVRESVYYCLKDSYVTIYTSQIYLACFMCDLNSEPFVGEQHMQHGLLSTFRS